MSLQNKTDKELLDMLDKIDDEIVDLQETCDEDIRGLTEDKHYIYQEIIRREKGE